MIYVVSTISDSAYGSVFTINAELVFFKHKPVVINKNQKPPKVCTEIQKTHRVITPEELKTKFRITTDIEISILEMQEEKQLLSK